MKAFSFLVALAATLHAAPPEPKFRAVTIDDKIQIGYGVAVADVDGDKRPDILLADKKQFVWYQNPGQPPPGAESFAPSVWSKFVLAENLTEHDNVCLAAQDLDGDGKCEIAVGAEWNPGDTVNSGAVFYLIAPADRTQKWEPVKFPNVEPTTHRMRWTRRIAALGGRADSWDLIVVPLHGRANKNGEGVGVKVVAYNPPTSLNDPKGKWKPEWRDDAMHMTHNFDRVDDGEFGDRIIVGGREGVRGFVRDDVGGRHLATFPGIGLARGGVGEVRQGRLADGRNFIATVEPMHGNHLVFYRAGTPPNSPPWEAGKVLTNQLLDGHALACGDLLGGGSDQIVVGWRAMGKPEAKVGVHLWTALDPEGKDWRDSALDDGGMACEDLVLADLNADGKLDIIASGRGTKNVKVYFNETAR